MDLIFTGDQIFLLVLAVIFLIAVIVIVVAWYKSSVSKNDIVLLEKQAELKKIEIVERDLENKQRKESFAQLSDEDMEQLKSIRNNTSELSAKVGLLSSQVNERVELLEVKNELVKLQKLSVELDKKEKELNDLLGN
ncbi:MAG: hypothetical protein BZ135_05420 [Methanosphaera sp. rholeuAM6]|nr:MAG: hypothetical protein BZ135_05420 [Methanosphaera sp. rholeuAM6]